MYISLGMTFRLLVNDDDRMKRRREKETDVCQLVDWALLYWMN